MLMDAVYYLPSEEFKYTNYPEVFGIMDKINSFTSSLEPIMLAVSDYDQGETDGIYVNIAEVERIREVSFEISEILGLAPKVCYDILLPIREAQEALNELIFSFKFEEVPVVFDIQRTDLQTLNNVVNKYGEEVE